MSLGAILTLLIAVNLWRNEARNGGRGFDTGMDPVAFEDFLGGVANESLSGWGRLRGTWEGVTAVRRSAWKRGLRSIRRAGLETTPFVTGRRAGSGVRKLPNARLPLDLREAHAVGGNLGRDFGAFVSAWEIENEPELVYVAENPENYVAYFKAKGLGLRAGTERTMGWLPPKAQLRTVSSAPRAAAVLMAPTGIPPGPYWEAAADNEILSYTDGFNFHSYGYAQDFSGVYRMFEEAVAERDTSPLLSSETVHGRSPPVIKKSLPIFLTEYGYGLLSGPDANTVEGRVRQWRYFRDVSEQIRQLRIAAPMAFYLPPYFEQDSREYGLLLAPRNPATSDPATSNLAPGFSAGGLEFRPSDFGTAEVEPWMRDIGRKFGDWEASPAMAWLINQPPIENPRAWEVRVPAPSPVVIDFIAGDDLKASKSYRGHFLMRRAEGGWAGGGELRIYNFHRAAVKGTLFLDGVTNGPRQMELHLKSGEMTRVPIEFFDAPERFRGRKWRAEFWADETRHSRAVFSSWIYPAFSENREERLEDFSAAGEAVARNAAVLDQRPRAPEEETLVPQGRWRVTKGGTVTEENGTWRFVVTGFPDEPLRPAVAELPLRDGFQFTPNSFFGIEHRLLSRTIERVEPVAVPRAERYFSALDREPIGFNIRTRTGNLFTMSFHFACTTQWESYLNAAANFTVAPYARMERPWRFFEHEPAALVFHFRPRLLPAVYEVRNARVVELVAP